MKKTSTSRRKKLPLLLGALLILSVAAYGTRAYFSDSSSQQANIELQLGNIDITTSEDQVWKTLSKGNEIETTQKQKGEKSYTSITNVKPGDAFVKQYKIENTGSLEAEIKIDYLGKYITADGTYDGSTKTYTVKDGPFLISISNLEKSFNLKSKDSRTYNVTIAVDPNASNELYNKKDGNLDKVVANFLDEVITVNAKQTAAK